MEKINKCNQCSVDLTDDQSLPLSVDGWYSSNYLEDLTRYRFVLCEACIKKTFENFEIKPQIIEIHVDGYPIECNYEIDKLEGIKTLLKKIIGISSSCYSFDFLETLTKYNNGARKLLKSVEGDILAIKMDQTLK